MIDPDRRSSNDLAAKHICEILDIYSDSTGGSGQGHTSLIHGPVLPVFKYRDISEVISFIRQGEKPLALYIFSKNRSLVNAVRLAQAHIDTYCVDSFGAAFGAERAFLFFVVRVGLGWVVPLFMYVYVCIYMYVCMYVCMAGGEGHSGPGAYHGGFVNALSVCQSSFLSGF